MKRLAIASAAGLMMLALGVTVALAGPTHAGSSLRPHLSAGMDSQHEASPAPATEQNKCDSDEQSEADNDEQGDNDEQCENEQNEDKNQQGKDGQDDKNNHKGANEQEGSNQKGSDQQGMTRDTER